MDTDMATSKNGKQIHKNLLSELEDFYGVGSVFDDQDMRKELKKIRNQLFRLRNRLYNLGFTEIINLPIPHAIKLLEEFSSDS